MCAQYRAQHHQEGHDTAVQWQGVPLQGQDCLECLSEKQKPQLPDIRSPGEASFLTICGEALREDQWSLDACVGRALEDGSFDRSKMLCTKTLYNYVDLGLINIKNIDLPQKLSRNTKIHKNSINKRIMGRSIEERPKEVDTREEFGHWETDLVIGQKSGKDNVLLTLLERKTRDFSIMRLPDKSADSVLDAFQKLQSELGDYFSKVFRTITTDNGSEFARLSELETGTSTKVYFTHPYTSCEKGAVENHNGLIRRFIPKGKRISDYSDDDILAVELWANSLPRKVLGYKTPDEALGAEIDKIDAA